MKSVAVILGSSRKNGHTQQIINELQKDVQVTVFNLLDFQIAPYRYDHRHDDDFLELMEKLMEFDVWLLATPVYWYSMSGEMKIFLDRWTDMLKIRKDLGRAAAGKSLAWLSCGSESEEVPGFEQPFKLTAGYMDMDYAGGCHTWLNGSGIEEEVSTRIHEFAKRMKEV